MKYNNDRDMIYIGLYVDDIIIAGRNVIVIKHIKKKYLIDLLVKLWVI